MNTITLHINGSTTQDGKTNQSEGLELLSSQISLEPGYLLRSFFEMIEKYPIYEKFSPFFPSHLEQFRQSPNQGCNGGLFDYLEFNKTIEMIAVPEKRLEIYNSLLGVAGDETGEIKSIQLVHLLDLPVKLGRLKHIVFGDRVDIFEFDTVYTLFDFIDGVAWHLSFHGTPEQCEMRR